jgi:PAS domain S-box-containing protein
MADFNGRYFASNSAFRNMLGYTERELYRLSFDEVTCEGDRGANVLLASETYGRQTTTLLDREALSSQRDGTLFWTRQHVAPVPGMRGVAPFWFAVVEDITERKCLDLAGARGFTRDDRRTSTSGGAAWVKAHHISLPDEEARD